MQSAPPAVLQCKCGIVISDTMLVEGELAEFGTYIVRGISGALVDTVQQNEHVDDTFNRTYTHIICRGCGTAVGRAYQDVEPAMQRILPYFLLNAAQLNRQELGNCEIKAPAAAMQSATASPTAMQERLLQLERDYLNVQHLMCVHNERLDKLYNILGIPERQDGSLALSGEADAAGN